MNHNEQRETERYEEAFIASGRFLRPPLGLQCRRKRPIEGQGKCRSLRYDLLGLIEAVPGVFCGQSCEAESIATGSEGAPTQPLFRVIG